MAWGRGPLTGDQTNGWRDGGWETEAKCDRLAREGRETAASKAHHTFRRSSDEQRVGLGDPASPSSRKGRTGQDVLDETRHGKPATGRAVSGVPELGDLVGEVEVGEEEGRSVTTNRSRSRSRSRNQMRMLTGR